MLRVDFRKRFPANGGPAVEVDVALSAGAGITVLFGPSGAGKTTVLGAVAGVVAPDEGRIALGERVLFDSRTGVNVPIRRRRVGYVFQDSALFPHLTVEQNVSFGARPAGRGRELLEMLGAAPLAGRYPRELSGGEKQRVALARALAAGPEALLLDEPLAAVDVPARAELLDELLRVQRGMGIPFLYVTHSVAEATRVGDFAYVLAEGRVAQAGRPLALLDAPGPAAVAWAPLPRFSDL